MKMLSVSVGALASAIVAAGLARPCDACLLPAFRLRAAETSAIRAYLRLTAAPGVTTRYDALIAEAARRHGLDPRLLKAVIAAESGFDPEARSPRGAIGLMQLMPSTAAELGVRGKLTDPAVNIAAGAAYLALLRRVAAARFGEGENPRLLRGRIVAAYNAGPRALSGRGWCKQTRLYVDKVLMFYDLDWDAPRAQAQQLTASAD